MEIDILKLIRPQIMRMEPYRSAREESYLDDGLFLDANENAFGSAVKAGLNRYPDPLQRKLKEKIASLKGILPDQIFIGNGSDEAIDLLFRIFCEPRTDRVIIPQPTYGMYEVCAAVNGVAVVRPDLNPDFQPDVDDILSRADRNTKMIFLCSPNNPSGNMLNGDAVENILKNFPGMVVLDEAYIDFALQPGGIPGLLASSNLIILQTLSKAWGMAGIRIGTAFAAPEVIELLSKIKYPYNISSVSQQLALEALNNSPRKDEFVSRILEERRRLTAFLKESSLVEKVFPSDANFLLVRFFDAKSVFQRLTKEKIIVRDRSSLVNCRNCLRITVGKPQENDRLMEILKIME